MIVPMVTGALGDERREVFFPVPAAETLWLEAFRVLPQPAIVARAVYVQYDPVLCFKPVPAPGEGFIDASGDDWEERIVPADFLDEWFKVGLVIGGKGLRPFRVFFQCHGSKGNKARDRDGGPQDVDQFHRGKLG